MNARLTEVPTVTAAAAESKALEALYGIATAHFHNAREAKAAEREYHAALVSARNARKRYLDAHAALLRTKLDMDAAIQGGTESAP